MAFAFVAVAFALLLVTFTLFLVAFAFVAVAFVFVAVHSPRYRLGFVGRFQDNPRVAVFQRIKGTLQPRLKLQPVHHNQVCRPDRPQVRGRWLKPMRFHARCNQRVDRYQIAANSFREVAQRIDAGHDGQTIVIVRVLPAAETGNQDQDNCGNGCHPSDTESHLISLRMWRLGGLHRPFPVTGSLDSSRRNRPGG